jgi:hypothetical protein
VIFVGYVQWFAYWSINSVVVRTVQIMYPESLLGKTLATMQ